MDLPGVDPDAAGALAIEVDVTSTGSVQAAFDRAAASLAGVDVPVNNAGIAEDRQRLRHLTRRPGTECSMSTSGVLSGAQRAQCRSLNEVTPRPLVTILSTLTLGGVAGFHA